MTNVVSVVGPEKSGKSDWLITAPKPIFYQEFDIGSYDRAVWRHPSIDTFRVEGKGEELWPMTGGDASVKDYTRFTSDLIILRQYRPPVQGDSVALATLKSLVRQHGTGKSTRVATKASPTLVGYKEQWYDEFIPDYIAACEDPMIKTIAWDTGASIWSACHHTLLQEKQERGLAMSPPQPRESLIQIEYSDANDRMRSMIQLAREYGKHLVVAHHARPKYQETTNNRGQKELLIVGTEPEGWSHFPKNVDLEVWTSVTPLTPTRRANGEHAVPKAKITISGLTLDAIGLEQDDSSWDKIFSVIDGQRAIAMMGQKKVEVDSNGTGDS